MSSASVCVCVCREMNLNHVSRWLHFNVSFSNRSFGCNQPLLPTQWCDHTNKTSESTKNRTRSTLYKRHRCVELFSWKSWTSCAGFVDSLIRSQSRGLTSCSCLVRWSSGSARGTLRKVSQIFCPTSVPHTYCTVYTPYTEQSTNCTKSFKLISLKRKRWRFF